MRWVVVVILLTMVAGCVGSATRPPQIVSAGGLEYPVAAAAQRLEGYVVVSYAVTASGEVVDERVVEANPPGLFDEAALKAVRSWHFNAGVRRGEFIDTVGLLSRIEFKLGESDAYVR